MEKKPGLMLSPESGRSAMTISYVPLLHEQRRLQGLPRNFERFEEYLRTVLNADRSDVRLTPLLAMNPMGRDHVTDLLEAYLAMEADDIARRAVEEAELELASSPGDFKASLVLVDDLRGGWTNRWSYEYELRKPAPGRKRFWITGYLWSSEPAEASTVRERALVAVYRTAYVLENGPARTLGALLRQEGTVMRRAGCTSPALGDDEIDYTRAVLEPLVQAEDMRTGIECLFGDAAARSLGFTPRGLSPWAGIALALHDARIRTTA
jgi:hypothetical protein